MDFQINNKLNDALIKIKTNDSYGVDIIYNTIGGRMLSVAIGIVKNKQTAEDIVQESFVKIIKYINKYNVDTNAYAWICKIVRNTALNKLKSISKTKSLDIDEFHNISGSDDMVKSTEEKILVERLMLKLSVYQRKIIYMKYFLDMTIREIAKELKISKTKIHKDINSCESFMKNSIKEKDKI